MKNLKHIIFTLLLVSFGCSNNSDTSTNTSSHIKHFGFSLIDVFWDDPTDEPSNVTNYINEVSAFTNIADILVINPTDNIAERLNIMATKNVKSYLHLSTIFFVQNGTNAPSGTNYNLRIDYQQRWDTFINTNNLTANTNNIVAFYIGEEPTWNGVSFNDLKLASDYIKSTIAETPILIIEAYTAVSNLEVPTSVDWVGFDHYFIKDPKNNTTFLNELVILKSKLSTPNQRIVFVMDTHYINSIHGNQANIEINEMKSVANSYYQLAKSEPKTIAIIGYFWPSGFDLPEAIGARHMPQTVKDEYQRIGLEITQK